MSHNVIHRLRAWLRDLEVTAKPLIFRVFVPFLLLNVTSILVSQNGLYFPLWVASFVLLAHGAVMLRRKFVASLDQHIESRVVGALVSVLHVSQHSADADQVSTPVETRGASYADQLQDLAVQDADIEAAA